MLVCGPGTPDQCRGLLVAVPALAKGHERPGIEPVCNDNYRGRSYCLTGECSRDVKRCLTKCAPVASFDPPAEPQLLFRFLNQCLLDVGPVELWATR